MPNALLLLADGRFPAGGHAHSAGVEAAVADGRVTDLASLTSFTEGRLRRVGLVEIAFAMAAAVHLGDPREGKASPRPLDAVATLRVLGLLDAEADARTPAPPLRAASRRLGRQLLRAGARCWPCPLLALVVEARIDPHQSVAFGLVGLAASLPVEQIGQLVAHHAVTTPMQAGVRLLGLDPYAAAAAMAALAGVAAAVVAAATAPAAGPIEALPAASATLVDLASMAHASANGRLFAT